MLDRDMTRAFPAISRHAGGWAMSRFPIIAVILNCRRIIADRIRLIQPLRQRNAVIDDEGHMLPLLARG